MSSGKFNKTTPCMFASLVIKNAISSSNPTKTSFDTQSTFLLQNNICVFFISKEAKEAGIWGNVLVFPSALPKLICFSVWKYEFCVRNTFPDLWWMSLETVFPYEFRVQSWVQSVLEYFLLWLTLDMVHSDVFPKLIVSTDAKRLILRKMLTK